MTSSQSFINKVYDLVGQQLYLIIYVMYASIE